MVGGHRVAQQGQHPRPADVVHGRHVEGQPLEVGRLLDVGRLRVPAVQALLARLAGRDGIPGLVAGVDVGILLLEHLRVQGRGHRLLDLGLAGPDVLEVDRLAVAPLAQGLLGQVHVHGTGQGIGHHQGR